MLPHPLKAIPQVLHMLIRPLKLHHHIINVDFHEMHQHIMEYCIHGPLVCFTYILQAKRHDQALKHPNEAWTPEGSL